MTEALESVKNLHFNGIFLTKVNNVWKKYRGGIFHDTREWCKIWRKTDFFGKWHEEFGKFSPEHVKVLKLGPLLGPFIQSGKCMSLVFAAVICYDNEEWRKIWKRIELSVQNWHEKFNKFWPEH